MVLFVMVLRYIALLVLDAVKQKKKFWKSFWSYYDMLNYLLFLMVFMNRFQFKSSMDLLLSALPPADELSPIPELASTFKTILSINSFNVVLSFLKIFKYTQLSPKISQITRTLVVASKDLIIFSIMFFLVLFAYCLAFYLAFGTSITDYSTPTICFFSVVRILLGDFDLMGLYSANKVLGPFLFLSYIMVVVFILLNMFLAILADAYTAVKEAPVERDPFVETIVSMVGSRLNWMTRLGGMKASQIGQLQHQMQFADTDGDGLIDIDELREMVGAEKAEEIMAMFDKDGDGTIDQEELTSMQSLLEEAKREKLAQEAGEAHKPATPLKLVASTPTSEVPPDNKSHGDGDHSSIVAGDSNASGATSNLEAGSLHMLQKVLQRLQVLEQDAKDSQTHQASMMQAMARAQKAREEHMALAVAHMQAQLLEVQHVSISVGEKLHASSNR